ncbi:hypothetical protein FZI85_10060 [Mycobacterium sp. CBMA293]|nr:MULTISPECIES: hypothetical protein [unclassified Mycolicibacterium]MUL46068.1 hypothetical protein [Mycolicibacterium sp. CBMA 360]MUL69278.1 hypothetical protein [Mycolicibacterium sp. CBMA 311]MUL94242.1 hypothetical protein [Mycolicibacterium sp. CBMA 230]MUM11371.1 hypothetical protein [Mycolicibacterium sp. CBMA 293]
MAKVRRVQVVRSAFGVAMCVLFVWSALQQLWFCVFFAVLALFVTLAFDRWIFRAAVGRVGDDIVCRYFPLYEANIYGLLVMLLSIVAACIAGWWYKADGMGWVMLIFGAFMLGVAALSVFGAIRMWRRCILRICPSSLAIRMVTPATNELTVVRREQVQSIESKMTPNPLHHGTSMEVEIVYCSADLGEDSATTMMLGRQISVAPTDLLDALVTWRAGSSDDPTELSDTVEKILRGHATVGVRLPDSRMITTDTTDNPSDPSAGRNRRGVAGRIVRRLVITGVWLALAFVLAAGLLVIYQNLGSQFCDGHRMGADDTCSTLVVRLPRSTHISEKLNSARTAPAELAPDKWRFDPKQPHTVVYTADGIRGFHREGGVLWLCVVTVEVLLVGVWVRHWLRARRPSYPAEQLKWPPAA